MVLVAADHYAKVYKTTCHFMQINYNIIIKKHLCNLLKLQWIELAFQQQK